MNSIVAVIFFAALATSCAGWVSPLALSAIPTGHVIQGPSSRSTIVGPDGSSISSAAPGGTIIADNNGAIIAQGAPSAVISSAPRIAVAAPVISSYAAIAPVWAQQAVAVPAIGRIAAENTVVAGPSGTIAQSRAIDAAHTVTVW
ncbi:uncharacterized protein LOC123308594 [Coccinella septempunctata]|uniref:uncharacterized protein LOC123308594 n=1 Tax=Coccinella septempunctata TaxID=41139 RepID=UPI001D079133|nr:uncharacterized protein LOC123308594 [Coccinella septempunctata]